MKAKGVSNETVDTHFFGLFDGHAGGRCSKFVSTTFTDNLTEDVAYGHNLPQAVKRCFYNTNEQFLQIAERMKLHDGSTGICGIVRDGKVLVSNVGDCRCIILSNGKPIQMSVDQKPTSPDEQRRIASFGGTVVYCMGTARVNGVLAVSRAFGNRTLRSVIRPDPELSMREFTKDDDYFIMASDGLWDVLRNVDVSHIAYNCVNSSGHNATSTGPICQSIAEELVNAALSRGSMDNVYVSKYQVLMGCTDCITAVVILIIVNLIHHQVGVVVPELLLLLIRIVIISIIPNNMGIVLLTLIIIITPVLILILQL